MFMIVMIIFYTSLLIYVEVIRPDIISEQILSILVMIISALLGLLGITYSIAFTLHKQKEDDIIKGSADKLYILRKCHANTSVFFSLSATNGIDFSKNVEEGATKYFNKFIEFYDGNLQLLKDVDVFIFKQFYLQFQEEINIINLLSQFGETDVTSTKVSKNILKDYKIFNNDYYVEVMKLSDSIYNEVGDVNLKVSQRDYYNLYEISMILRINVESKLRKTLKEFNDRTEYYLKLSK